MSSVLRRLFNIVRASFPHRADDTFENFSERYRQWYERTGGESSYWEEEYAGDSEERYSEGFYDRAETQGYPQHVIDDLGVFNLTPPSSLDEVRRARNREIKKYHSDKFMDDPEKLETSKQIMQIVNAAYDRLKVYYKEQEG